MGAEAEQTINEQQPGASSAPSGESGDLVSTIPVPETTPSSEETLNPEDQTDSKGSDENKGEEKAGGGGEETSSAGEQDKNKGDDARLDKHPRFKQLVDINRELREQIKAHEQEKEAARQQKPEAGVKPQSEAQQV